MWSLLSSNTVEPNNIVLSYFISFVKYYVRALISYLITSLHVGLLTALSYS